MNEPAEKDEVLETFREDETSRLTEEVEEQDNDNPLDNHLSTEEIVVDEDGVVH
ncbi:MAG: hypothetical protein IC227_06565 [Enterococcus lacertideformus]|uniref:Uncharacterized protein n=1 Tax=Enterococcus lacertideformus TaxID=2771493 RepID=A0A931F9V3_9ENTE|nr:hypothetical protein [Enterococcus lacertideformus]